jgi:SNF2 family DNA or RNA helicase
VLVATLGGLPPVVRFERGADVPDEFWVALAQIDPDRNQRYDSAEVAVSLERLLARRTWLGYLVRQYRFEVVFDESCLAALDVASREHEEVSLVLEHGISPEAESSLRDELAGSRFSPDRRLKSFQLRDLGQILAVSHGANFSVPGSGKTTVALAAYELLRQRDRVEQMLVVAPLSAFEAWFEEAEACFTAPPPRIALFRERSAATEVAIINYQRLMSSYQELARWISQAPTQVVLDEAHRMKRGRNGEWGTACLDLAPLAARRDLLTGTPAPQHPSDLIALLDFQWPQQARRILPDRALVAQPAQEAMRELSVRMRPVFARTQKDELGLEPPKLRIETVEMKPLQREIYLALRTRARRALATSNTAAQLAQMGNVAAYLLQAAVNPGLLASALGGVKSAKLEWPSIELEPGSGLAEKVRRYGSLEVPRKIEKLVALIDENVRLGRKTLVWSNIVAVLRDLHERTLEPYNPAIVYGGVPADGEEVAWRTREKEIRKFRSDAQCWVLVANPAAMSEGISLHRECHDAVYVDRTFNAGQYLQSLDRIHRLGLAPGTETRITFLVSTATIDETVDQRVSYKARALSDMLSDPQLVEMSLPDEEFTGEWIDPDDLDALLSHLASNRSNDD